MIYRFRYEQPTVAGITEDNIGSKMLQVLKWCSVINKFGLSCHNDDLCEIVVSKHQNEYLCVYCQFNNFKYEFKLHCVFLLCAS